MGLVDKIKNDVIEKGEIVFKAWSVQSFLFLTIASQIVVIWFSTKGSLFPGKEDLMGIVGNCAQIVAGLYGITMAGYTFFLSRMDALMASDTTLDYIIKSVKNRFKYLVWYITFNVLVTLFISIFLMYCPIPAEETQVFWYRLFCNEFVSFSAFSIVLILYYSLNVIEPNCLEKEAQKQKKKLSRSSKNKGDVLAFISMYDEIENVCNALLPKNVLGQIHENKGKHFEYTIELLNECKPTLRPIIPELKRIHRYYECVVNSVPMTVSQEMCTKAQKVLVFLKTSEDSRILKRANEISAS